MTDRSRAVLGEGSRMQNDEVNARVGPPDVSVATPGSTAERERGSSSAAERTEGGSHAVAPGKARHGAQLACINCGEAYDGGYQTEEVGPLCSQCYLLLDQHFKPAALPRVPEPDLLAALERIAAMKKCRPHVPHPDVPGQRLSAAAANDLHTSCCPYCTAREGLRAARAGAEAPPRCTWDEDEDGVWRTDCGHAWTFEDAGAPNDHQARFCFYCGLPITANTYAEDEPEAGAEAPPPEGP